MHSMQLWTSPKRRRISSRHSNPSTVEDRQIRCPASLESVPVAGLFGSSSVCALGVAVGASGAWLVGGVG